MYLHFWYIKKCSPFLYSVYTQMSRNSINLSICCNTFIYLKKISLTVKRFTLPPPPELEFIIDHLTSQIRNWRQMTSNNGLLFCTSICNQSCFSYKIIHVAVWMCSWTTWNKIWKSGHGSIFGVTHVHYLLATLLQFSFIYKALSTIDIVMIWRTSQRQ